MIRSDAGEFLTWPQSYLTGKTWGGGGTGEARCFVPEMSIFQESHVDGIASLLLASS